MVRSTGYQLIKYPCESIHAMDPAVGQALGDTGKKWHRSQTHGLGLLYLRMLQQMPLWTLVVSHPYPQRHAKHQNASTSSELLTCLNIFMPMIR